MLNKFHWILPAHFMSKDHQHLELDFTECLQTFIQNEFWNRKISYEKIVDLSADTLAKYTSLKIKLLPHKGVRFNVLNQSVTILNELFGEVHPNFQYIIDRGNLRTAKSLAIISIEYESDIPLMKNLNKEDEFSPERIGNLSEDFQTIYFELITLANEIASFFLTALHLVFPTRNSGIETSMPQSSGLLVIENESARYFEDLHSNILGHPILLDSNQTIKLAKTLDILANIWHKDLWTIHSLLKALRSDHIEIDNLIELVFTLESLFPKSTSAETIRTASVILTSENLKTTQEVDLTISTAFSIRNEVVHGGMHYRIMDCYLHHGKQKLIATLFWDLKEIVIHLVIVAINKILKDGNKDQNKLGFTVVDLYQKYFSKQTKSPS